MFLMPIPLRFVVIWKSSFPSKGMLEMVVEVYHVILVAA